MVEFEIFATANIIKGSLVAYQHSKDPGSNPDTVECVSFSTERFQILKKQKKWNNFMQYSMM